MPTTFRAICRVFAFAALTAAGSFAAESADHPPLVLKDLPAGLITPAPTPAALFDLFGTFSVQTYRLAKGDTLSAIARDHGITLETILSYNRIQSPRFLQAGQEINIPSVNGILISVPEPTTVADIIRQYQVPPDWFTTVNARLISDGKISGDVFLPGLRVNQDVLAGELGVMLNWPTTGGRISSFYGARPDPFTGVPSRHQGLDIATYWGAPVFAAAGGTVYAHGYDSVLGNYIRVSCGKGVTILYGHLSKIMVRNGQKLIRGTQIGRVGSTGYSTGPHLHFGVHKNGRLINPMLIFN